MGFDYNETVFSPDCLGDAGGMDFGAAPIAAHEAR
jgi:hypothetical protein